MIRYRFVFPALVAFVLASAPAFADSITSAFNFDTTPINTRLPLVLTDNGITATFTSPDGPVFSVADAFFLVPPMTGRVLGDFDDGFLHALDIKFSEQLSSLTLDFAVHFLGAGDPNLSLTAFLGSSVVGSTSALADFGFLPQGALAFGGVAFDSVRLTSNKDNFAIDNINVRAVPEPSTVILVALGLVGIAVRRKIISVRT